MIYIANVTNKRGFKGRKIFPFRGTNVFFMAFKALFHGIRNKKLKNYTARKKNSFI